MAKHEKVLRIHNQSSATGEFWRQGWSGSGPVNPWGNMSELAIGTGSRYFHIGGSDQYAMWSGAEQPGDASFILYRDGRIKATAGQIANFYLESERLVYGYWIEDPIGGDTWVEPFILRPRAYGSTTGGYLQLGLGDEIVRLDSGHASYRIWAGDADPASAEFSVTKEGFLRATSAYFSGEVHSGAGQIGGWTLGEHSLSSSNIALYSLDDEAPFTPARILVGTGSDQSGLASTAGPTDIAIWAGDEYAHRASAPFRVEADGSVYAKDGTIGGWVLSEFYMKSSNSKVWLDSAGIIAIGNDVFGEGNQVVVLSSTTDWRLWAGNWQPLDAPFRVDNTGEVWVTKVHVGDPLPPDPEDPEDPRDFPVSELTYLTVKNRLYVGLGGEVQSGTAAWTALGGFTGQGYLLKLVDADSDGVLDPLTDYTVFFLGDASGARLEVVSIGESASMYLKGSLQVTDGALIGGWMVGNIGGADEGALYYDDAGSPIYSDVVPEMSNNTTPSPYVASASATEVGAAYLAFDGSTADTSHVWGMLGASGWLQIDLGAGNAQTVVRYRITAVPVGEWTTCAPKAWVFAGSSNGTDWTPLDTVAGETGWAENTAKTFYVDVPAEYRYYRITISENNGYAFTEIAELYLDENIGSNAANFSAGMDPAAWPFYAGAVFADRATAPFRVTPSGVVYARRVEAGMSGWTPGEIGDLPDEATLNSLGILGTLQIGTGGLIRSGTADYVDSAFSGVGYLLKFLDGTPDNAVMMIGDVAGHCMTWDGSELEITGNVHISEGALIGGWTIGADSLSSFGVVLHADADPDPAYISFGATPPAAPNSGTGVYIDKTGLYGLSGGSQKVVVSAADGTLTAVAGSIGGFEIGASYLRDATNKVYLLQGGLVGVGNDGFGEAGVQMAYAGGAGKFYAGDGANHYMTWDGNAFMLKSGTGLLVLDSSTSSISGNYTAGIKGFYLSGQTGFAEFQDIKARGRIIGTTLVNESINVVGGLLAVTPGSNLAQDMVVEAGPSTIYIEDAIFETPGVLGEGDLIELRTAGEYEVIQVITAAASGVGEPGAQKLTVGRAVGGTRYAWKKGTPVARWMSRITLAASVFQGDPNPTTPAVSIIKREWSGGVALDQYVGRFGNLYDSFDYAAETYGMTVGVYDADTEGPALTVDTAQGFRLWRNHIVDAAMVHDVIGWWDASGNVSVGDRAGSHVYLDAATGHLQMKNDTDVKLELDDEGNISLAGSLTVGSGGEIVGVGYWIDENGLNLVPGSTAGVYGVGWNYYGLSANYGHVFATRDTTPGAETEATLVLRAKDNVDGVTKYYPNIVLDGYCSGIDGDLLVEVRVDSQPGSEYDGDGALDSDRGALRLVKAGLVIESGAVAKGTWKATTGGLWAAGTLSTDSGLLLKERAAPGTIADNYGFLYAADDGGTTKLYFKQVDTATCLTDLVGDHGALTGLADDDHTQYIHTAPGSDTRNVISPTAASKGLVIKGAVAQADSLQEWRDFGDNVLASVSQTGGILTVGVLDARGGVVINEDAMGYDFRVESLNYDAIFVDGSENSLQLMSNVAGKVGFFGATAVVRQAHIANAKADYTTGDLDTEAEVITAVNATNTALNSVLSKLEAYGLLATS